jgi:hypothetical protein
MDEAETSQPAKKRTKRTSRRKKRADKEAEDYGGIGAPDKLRNAVFGDRNELRQIRVACGHLKRVKQPESKHIHRFIERVFEIAGVAQS